MKVTIARTDKDGLWQADFIVRGEVMDAEIAGVRLNGTAAPASTFVGRFGLGVYDEALDMAIFDEDEDERLDR